jgi:hypothetical protein
MHKAHLHNRCIVLIALGLLLALGAPLTTQAAPLAQEATSTPAPEETAEPTAEPTTEPTAEAEIPGPAPTEGPIETPGREAFAASSGMILGIGLTGLLFVIVALWAVYTTRQEREQQRQQE